jgi:formyltetrahydrofolate deformylase
MDTSNEHYILKINCPATSGIVATLTSCLASQQCYISELAQFDDEFTGQFFMRAVFRFNRGATGDIEALQRELAALAGGFDMQWQLFSSSEPTRVLLMVSKFDHCLTDLLYRWRTGSLGGEVAVVVSNHQDLSDLADTAGVPFIHIPVITGSKPAAEQRLLQVIDEQRIDLVVLARYMQVLSDPLCRTLRGRAINIHHSFLPSFAGAKPYHQAYERGVKYVGATAHYVTAELDEGPIIEQELTRVDHRRAPEDLIAVGRDAERLALAREVTWHCQHRILLNGNRTIVFN